MTLPQTNHCCLSAGLSTSDLSGLLLEDGDRATILTKPAPVSSVDAVTNNIEKVELMSGDTVVAIGKTHRGTFWASFTRGLEDWSQIFYQFGLSAAAIQTLRN